MFRSLDLSNCVNKLEYIQCGCGCKIYICNPEAGRGCKFDICVGHEEPVCVFCMHYCHTFECLNKLCNDCALSCKKCKKRHCDECIDKSTEVCIECDQLK